MERSKLKTMEKLLTAVGDILVDDGFKKIGVNNVAKRAGVNKKLIYRYFDSFDNLVEQSMLQIDFWESIVDKTNKATTETMCTHIKDLINYFLEKQFDTTYYSDKFRHLLLWSISEINNPLMKKIIDNRERIGNDVFQKASQHFSSSAINFRATAAILVAGIYYLSLHARVNSGTFCGIDLNEDMGQAEIKRAIRMINDWAFEAAKEKT